MALTVLDVVRRVRNIIEGGRPNRINLTTGTVTTGTTALTLVLGSGMVPMVGQTVEVDGEAMLVVGVTTATPAITVARGLDGHTAHSPGETILRLNPTILTRRICEALRAEMREWPTNLRQIRSKEIASLSATQDRRASLATLFGAQLDDDFDYPIAVSKLGSESDAGDVWLGGWHYAARPPATGVEATAADPYIAFTSGYDNTSTLRLYYAQPIRQDLFPTGTSNAALAAVNLEAMNVSEAWADLWAYGAAARLFPELESRRMELDAVAQSRHAEDVPPTSYLRLAQSYRQMAESNITAEVLRIMATYGVRSR